MVTTRSQAKKHEETSRTALEKAFCFYAEYHWDPLNQWVHIVFVPILLWSAMVMLRHVEGVLPASLGLGAGDCWCGNSPSIAIAAAYILYYLYLCFTDGKPALGVFAAASIFGIYYASEMFFAAPNVDPLAAVGIDTGFNAALFGSTMATARTIHIVSWIAQFVAHGVFEGRSPALLDSLMQSVFMAPLFVMIEVMFKFGLLGEFRSKVSAVVQPAVDRFHKSKKQE